MIKGPLIIPGHPRVLKNPKKILRRKDGSQFIGSPENYGAMKKAADNLALQWVGKPIDFPVSLKIMSYGAWKDGSGNMPDASNLYEFPQDALEKAGIITNDRLVEHHDGSRRIPLCSTCKRRDIISRGPNKGQYKDDCGHVRVCPFERQEIFIRDERNAEGSGEEASG